jgi:hypothetical protein
MRIPKNIISENQYTSGNEFVDATTNAPYQGYYYEYQAKFYSGSEFNPQSPEIIKIKESNSLFNNISTAVFSAISGITSQAILSTVVKGNPAGDNSLGHSDGGQDVSFYSRQVNISPTLIKSISEDTYLSIQKDVMYQTTYIGDYKGNTITLDQACIQLPGLESFLGG